MSVIEVKNVVKKWENNTVLKSVDLAVECSEIVGIIGHNGSGKTVLMKCICGFITPDSGEISVGVILIGGQLIIFKRLLIILRHTVPEKI